MAYYPLWQVSHGSIISNGSLHSSQLRGIPVVWWIDMPIEMQHVCESTLHSPGHLNQVSYQNDPFDLSTAIHVIDLQNMTILNTYNGELSHIRRKISDVLR